MTSVRSISFVLALLAATLFATIAVAAEDPTAGDSFGFLPEPTADLGVTALGHFVYVLEPGAQQTGEVRLSNPGPQPVTVELAAVDATTAQTGGSAYAPSDAQPAAVGTWLSLAEREVTLAPGEVRTARFEVQVPADVAPGQHLAGIAAFAVKEDAPATVEAEANEAGASINLQTRYVIAVQVDVPGDWSPSLTIADVTLIDQPSGPVVGISLRNDGNTFIRPRGTLTVTDAEGATVLEQPIEMGTFVAGTEVTYPVSWPGGPAAGTYGARVELEYGDEQTATYEGAFEVGAQTTAIAVASVGVTEARDQASGQLQFVDVAIAIDNPAAAVPNARLTLKVSRDGEPVEDFVLGSSLTLPTGSAEFRQRYFPLGGWTPGTYTFAVTLETVDPASGKASPLANYQAAATVVVG